MQGTVCASLTQRRGSENQDGDEKMKISPHKLFSTCDVAVCLKCFKLLVPLSQFPHHHLMGLVRVKKHEIDFQQSLTSILAISSCVLLGTVLPLFCQRLFLPTVTSISIRANASVSFCVRKSYICTAHFICVTGSEVPWVSESTEGLIKIQISGPYCQTCRFSKSEVGPGNLHLLQVPR